MDDMKDSGSFELRPLDAMNSLLVWMIQMTLCYELKSLDAMNKSKLWII